MNRFRTRIAACVLWWGTVLPGAFGQPAQPVQPAPALAPPVELTADAVQAQLKQIEDSPDPDKALQIKLTDFYQQALADLKLADEWAAKTAEFQRAQEEAPTRLEAIRAELAQSPAEVKPEVPPDASLQQLEQLLAQAEAALKTARDGAAALDAERARRNERRQHVPDAITAARQKLDDLVHQLQTPPLSEDVPALVQARTTALLARRKALQAELDCYDREITSYDARGELSTARRDQAARQVSQGEQLVKVWQDFVNERRRVETENAARAAEQARREAARKHPVLHSLAEANAALAQRRTTENLASLIEKATARLEEVTKDLARCSSDFNSISSRVQAGSLTQAMGMMLKQKRDALPDARSYRRKIADCQQEISLAQARIIEFGDDRANLADIEPNVRRLLESLGPEVTPFDRREIEQAARELFLKQREYLDALLADYTTYFNKLVDLDAAQRGLLAEAEKFRGFIDERILWVRSADLLSPADLRPGWAALRWLVEPRSWVDAVWSAARANPFSAILAAPAAVALLLLRPRIRNRLLTIGADAARSNARAFTPTASAVVLMVMLAGVWPLLLAYLGWWVAAGLEAPDFAKAISAGLQAVAVILFLADLIRLLCIPGGLADAHFHSAKPALRVVRHQLYWIVPLGLVATFIIRSVEWTGRNEWQNSLGRFVFVVMQVLAAVFFQRVFRPVGGILYGAMARNPSGWLFRFRYLWYPLIVALPLCVAILATTGYYYTALQLARRLRSSWLLVLVPWFVNALAVRWLLMSRRKLAFEQARKRREAARAAEEAAEVGDSGSSPDTEDESDLGVPSEEVDLSSLSAQSRTLLRSLIAFAVGFGLWFVWVDVLPALRILDRVELWSTTVVSTQTVAMPNGATEVRPQEKVVAVTLGSLALATLTLVISFVAVKNFPALLEMALLQHLRMDPGQRYAVNTSVRYVLTVVGVVVAAGQIGVGWGDVQWLVAALSVGLGFALQEIFANFVCGLIILFERPVRVGDVVTMGDVSGTVTRIRIRATTITDWDRKELIVPNKQFITGPVVNWSLSDTLLRVVLPVGVAYGTDTGLAERLLLETAAANPRVLAEPRPRVFFLAFGDSALRFELRAYVRNVDDTLHARHELHVAINDAFRRAGIEIAFPQQDIHIRSMAAPAPQPPSAQQEPSS